MRLDPKSKGSPINPFPDLYLLDSKATCEESVSCFAGLESLSILSLQERVPEGWMCRQCGYINKIGLRDGVEETVEMGGGGGAYFLCFLQCCGTGTGTVTFCLVEPEP
jgi:hypothetical protein